MSETDGFAEALALVPKGWWWSVGVCSVSCDASIGPDVAYCDKETLIAFDSGFHADVPQPSTVADRKVTSHGMYREKLCDIPILC